LVFKTQGLPIRQYPDTDHIDRSLLANQDRFFRIETRGRPLGIRASADGKTIFVANYLSDSVQIVDLDRREVAREIALGGPAEISLARRGEAIFYDGRRSLDQWYSCHSCHYDGGGNARPMDTFNDGTASTYKTVLPLHSLAETGPWTWHGWQQDLDAAMRKSMTSTMLGPEPTDDDVKAVLAFLNNLSLPPNPHLKPDGSLSALAERGKDIFFSSKAGCAQCHSGPLFTDGQVHDVGTGSASDAHTGYNTPSLVGVHRRPLLMHDGRAATLEELLSGPHSPDRVAGEAPLDDDELGALVAYLKSL
jgi:cytochrome c peroxidase